MEQSILDLCNSFSGQLELLTASDDLSVLTMADVIRRLSLHQHEPIEDRFQMCHMPRNAIKRFYKFIKACSTLNTPLFLDCLDVGQGASEVQRCGAFRANFNHSIGNAF